MKITYIVSSFPKLSETFVLSQITDLIDRGHDVRIIAFGRADEADVHEDVTRYGLLEKTHYAPKSPAGPGFTFDGPLVSALFFTDLIHAHFAAAPTDWALKVSKMLGIPFVFTAHAYDIFISPDKAALMEKFEAAARVITVSEFNRKYLLDLVGAGFSEKIEVIRCGIDLERFTPVERSTGDAVRVLFIGRFTEKKGLSYGLDAFAEVVKEHPDTELRIIGDGDLKDDVVRQIEALGLGDKALLLGQMPQSDVLKEMARADIFLLPSVTAVNGDSEGVPVSIMEAQAMGLPVVSTRHTGIPEVVLDGKSGFLVDERHTGALAGRLKELIKDPELRARMGREGRAHVEANFDHKDAIERLDGLFKRLFNERPLVSETAPERREILKVRAEGAGALLKGLDGEIRQALDEIKEKDKEIKSLQAYIDAVQNTRAYKAYTGLRKVFKK